MVLRLPFDSGDYTRPPTLPACVLQHRLKKQIVRNLTKIGANELLLSYEQAEISRQNHAVGRGPERSISNLFSFSTEFGAG